jgi:hypothetical protein
LDQLRTKLYRSAQEYHRAAVNYYRSLELTSVQDQKIAADEYMLTGKSYLTALSVVELHLVTIPRDTYLDEELKRIQSTFYSVSFVMKHL